jgi:hypothetical protein
MGVAVGFALTAGLTSQTVTFAMILVASGASENRGVVPPDRISARFVTESQQGGTLASIQRLATEDPASASTPRTLPDMALVAARGSSLRGSTIYL